MYFYIYLFIHVFIYVFLHLFIYFCIYVFINLLYLSHYSRPPYIKRCAGLWAIQDWFPWWEASTVNWEDLKL